MALMGLQCFFPLCKNNFWGQEEFMWPNEYSWLVQHLQLSTPWFQTCTNSGSSFNLECFFLRSFLLWKGPPLFVLPSVLWLNYEWNLQLPSCVMSSRRILFDGVMFCACAVNTFDLVGHWVPWMWFGWPPFCPWCTVYVHCKKKSGNFCSFVHCAQFPHVWV